MKGFFGLICAGLFFLCLAAYLFQNVMFPVTLAVAVDRALSGSLPGYAGEIAGWMLSDEEHPYGSPYRSKVLTPFDGYEGPTGFYSCGPHFIDTDAVDITSRFHEYRGINPDCNCAVYHGGIDYATLSPDRYPPLLAPISGKVVFAAWSKVGYGNLIVIENRGVRVYLAHLSSFAVGEGDIVSAGDLVGVIGTTGNSTGPHLHFEVRVQDQAAPDYGLVVDPSTVLLPGQTEACNWSPGEGRYRWELKGGE